MLKSFIVILAIFGFLFLVSVILNFLFHKRNENLKMKGDGKEKELNQLQREKDKDSIRQQATELEIRALRSQMNPHFIFNCLSSINKFIVRNETVAASDYLTRFSRLIRMVLINSGKPMISLEDELEMLRLYLDLERLRFKESFDYSITFTNSVAPSDIFVPPLLFQPFCENAIWHGLMNKTEFGQLTVAISSENDFLQCTISDNGVGREKAGALQSKSAEKQKSFGLKITNERFALMNKGNSINSSYEVEDIIDEYGNISGTEVILRIRYKEPKIALT